MKTLLATQTLTGVSRAEDTEPVCGQHASCQGRKPADTYSAQHSTCQTARQKAAGQNAVRRKQAQEIAFLPQRKTAARTQKYSTEMPVARKGVDREQRRSKQGPLLELRHLLLNPRPYPSSSSHAVLKMATPSRWTVWDVDTAELLRQKLPTLKMLLYY